MAQQMYILLRFAMVISPTAMVAQYTKELLLSKLFQRIVSNSVGNLERYTIQVSIKATLNLTLLVDSWFMVV